MSAQRTLTDFDTPEPVAGQTPTADLGVLDSPGDCRSCGGDVSNEVIRIVGRDGRVDACARCYSQDGRQFASDAESARRAHRDPSWPRDLGGGE